MRKHHFSAFIHSCHMFVGGVVMFGQLNLLHCGWCVFQNDSFIVCPSRLVMSDSVMTRRY